MGDRYKRSEAKKRSIKAKFLSEVNQAVSELNNVLAGRRQARDAYDLLDILDCSTRRNEPTRSFDDVKNEILTSRITCNSQDLI
jgi:hypothetical protein